MVTRRGRAPRSATGPSGLNSSVSTPHGTILMERRGTPSLVRSLSSSELPATTAFALRPMAGSSRIRSRPAPPGATWWRRSATPRESNDCTTGMRRSRAAAREARPLVQRSACTTSGRSPRHRSRSGWLNAGTCASRSDSPSLPAAAPMYSTVTPGETSARSGSVALCRCAYTVTRWPLLASDRLSSRSRESAAGPAVPSKAEPEAVSAEMGSPDMDVALLCCSRAIFIPGLLTAGREFTSRRSESSKAPGKLENAKTKKWATRGTHAIDGVERACVVGTTGSNHIPRGAEINSGRRKFIRRSPRPRSGKRE